VEEREKFDPEDGLLRGGDFRPPVPDAHILQRELEAREEADPQPAPMRTSIPGVGGVRLQPGFCAFTSTKRTSATAARMRSAKSRRPR